MNLLSPSSRTLFLLATVAALPYLFLLDNDYYYDDTAFIVFNDRMAQVQTLEDALFFSIQPSRPISNFFLGITHWLFGGLTGQRIVSILLHCLVVLATYLNLKLLVIRLKQPKLHWVPFGASLLFSLHPFHSGTVGIAVFRWEELGTLFILISMLMAQRISIEHKKPKLGEWLILALSIGFAGLSKEVYTLFGFIGVLSIYYLPGSTLARNSWDFLSRFILIQAFWTAILYALMSLPTDFPYVPNVDYDFLSPTHIAFASRSILEFIWKATLGLDLTTIQLRVRQGMGYDWATWIHVALLLLTIAGGFVLFKLRPWFRIWGFLLWMVLLFYAAVPNLDIGSEHYYYFALICWISLLCGTMAYCKSTLRRFCLISLAVYLSITMVSQISRMQDRLKFYLAEVEANPESAGAWMSLAYSWAIKTNQLRAVFESEIPDKLDSAGDAHLTTIALIYATRYRNPELANKLLRRLFALPMEDVHLAKFHAVVAVAAANEGRCKRSEELFRRAQSLHNDREIDSLHQAFLNQRNNRQCTEPEGQSINEPLIPWG